MLFHANLLGERSSQRSPGILTSVSGVLCLPAETPLTFPVRGFWKPTSLAYCSALAPLPQGTPSPPYFNLFQAAQMAVCVCPDLLISECALPVPHTQPRPCTSGPKPSTQQHLNK